MNCLIFIFSTLILSTLADNQIGAENGAGVKLSQVPSYNRAETLVRQKNYDEGLEFSKSPPQRGYNKWSSNDGSQSRADYLRSFSHRDTEPPGNIGYARQQDNSLSFNSKPTGNAWNTNQGPTSTSTFPSGRIPVRSEYSDVNQLSNGRKPQTQSTSVNGQGRLPQRIEIPLSYENGDYFGMMTVGDPKPGTRPQVLKVLFDTASPYIWVVSSTANNVGVDSKGNPKQCRKFDGSQSSRYSTRGLYADTSFVLGRITGFWSEDTVQVGFGNNAITIPLQGFAEATEIHDKALFSNFDGMVGLSIIREDLLGNDPKTLLMTIAENYGRVPKFGLYFCDNHPQMSKLVFADDHHDLIDGEFTTHKVVTNVRRTGNRDLEGWFLEFDGFHVGQPGKIPTVVPAFVEMMIFPDTGTDTIVGPPVIIDELYALIFAGTGITVSGPYYTFPCTNPIEIMRLTLHVLPVVGIVMNGRTYVLYPEDYLAIHDKTCNGVFVSMSNCKHILIGRTFLRNYYTVFDYENKQVHIGVAKDF